MSSKQQFLARSETFGLDEANPWARSALLAVYTAPRCYLPLAKAWDEKNPGTLKALKRLADSGLVDHQSGLLVDTATGLGAPAPGRPVARYAITSKGIRLLAASDADIRELADNYPRMRAQTSAGILELLAFFLLPEGARGHGRSIKHAVATSELPESVVRWWIARWAQDKILRELPVRIADTREVIPEHWRANKAGTKQLLHVLKVFGKHGYLKDELRLERANFLADIDPARIGVGGATDFDHDVKSQEILGTIMKDQRFAASGRLILEPRIVLAVDERKKPYSFTEGAAGVCFYQPDAEYREYLEGGGSRRAILEYERFQSRRDAWNHIERLLGYSSLKFLPGEKVTLRFVVDSKRRESGYVALIEAFADWARGHRIHMPAGEVTLAVSSQGRLEAAREPLGEDAWFRIELPTGEGEAILHHPKESPFDEYFSS